MATLLLPLLASAWDVLRDFAQSDGFWADLETAFGTSYDVVKATQLRQQWQSRNFGQLPPIEILSNEVLELRMVHIPVVRIGFIYQHLF